MYLWVHSSRRGERARVTTCDCAAPIKKGPSPHKTYPVKEPISGRVALAKSRRQAATVRPSVVHLEEFTAFESLQTTRKQGTYILSVVQHVT
jgi:hypothetical protein